MGFDLIRLLCRLLLAVFYRRIEVVGLERIPVDGPLIVAANHPNSIVDAMVLMAIVPRRLRVLAKAQLFSHPFVGPFLRLMGALPVQRRQEAGDDPDKNAALFAATTATLRKGGAILLFPEGVTQPEPVLQTLRTGAARMLLAAQAGMQSPLPVALLPVGLVFEKPGIFREGRAVVVVGNPVSTDCAEAIDATAQARMLTDRLTLALRRLIVEAPDREILRLTELVDTLIARSSTDANAVTRLERLKTTLTHYRWLAHHHPAPLADLAARLRHFDRALRDASLPFGARPRCYSLSGLATFVCRETCLLLLGLPLALGGILLHALPYVLTGIAARLIPHTDEEDASDKIAAGLLFYPLVWSAEAWLVWQNGGGLWLGIFLLLLAPLGLLAAAWLERLQAACREFRAFLHVLRHPDFSRQCLTVRQELQAEIEALAGLVPARPESAEMEYSGRSS